MADNPGDLTAADITFIVQELDTELNANILDSLLHGEHVHSKYGLRLLIVDISKVYTPAFSSSPCGTYVREVFLPRSYSSLWKPKLSLTLDPTEKPWSPLSCCSIS